MEAVLLLSAALAGAVAHVARNERRRRADAVAPVSWTPYVAGAFLGLVFAASLLVFGRPVGVSAGVQQVAHLIENVRAWRDPLDPATGWPLYVLIGVAIGGATSALLRLRAGDTVGVGRVSGTRLGGWAAAFGAGVLLQVAAIIAGGCTSGLALSGGIVLAPAAFIFMAGMFIGGIPAAWVAALWSRRRGRS